MPAKPSMNKKQRAIAPAPTKKKASTSKGKTPSRLYRIFVRTFQFVLISFALLVSWVVFIQWKVQIGPNQSSLPKQVDVGIVLGASLRNDIPSPGLQERLDLAVELYKQGRFKQLIVSGGLDHNGSKLTEAEGMRDYLVKNGLPKSSILIEPKATSTYENLLFSKQIMDEKSLVSAIIITHKFHSSRSLDIAETIGFKDPRVSGAKSVVLFMPYHDTRETLAYTNWYLTKLQLKLGLK